MKGSVLQTIGQNGDGDGEFNFPTELLVRDQNLFVVDAMNFRVQSLDRSGAVPVRDRQTGRQQRDDVPAQGNRRGFRRTSVRGRWPVGRGAGVRSAGPVALLLRRVGNGRWRVPVAAGLFIDHEDRIFVVDSYNRRMQVFRYYGLPKQAQGGSHEEQLLLASLMTLALLCRTIARSGAGFRRCVGFARSVAGRHFAHQRRVWIRACTAMCRTPAWRTNGAAVEPDSSRRRLIRPTPARTFITPACSRCWAADSGLCLSCHDGTVAVGQTQPFGQIQMTGNMYPGGRLRHESAGFASLQPEAAAGGCARPGADAWLRAIRRPIRPAR